MQILISLGFGLLVGVAYGLANVKSPAPPIVALFGLLGMVLGERGVAHFRPGESAPIAASDAGLLNGSADRPGPDR